MRADRSAGPASVAVMAAVCLLVLVAGPALDARRSETPVDLVAPSPPLIAGCMVTDGVTVPSWPEVHHPDVRVQAVYRCGSMVVSLDVARFLTQAPGKEAVTEGNRVVDTRFVSAPVPTVMEAGGGLPVRRYQLDELVEPGVLWHWYAIGDTPVANPLRAKIMEAGEAMLLRSPQTALFTVTAWTPDGPAADAVLETVARDVWHWYLQQ